MEERQSTSGKEERAAIENLLAKSRKTDIPAILQAKEKAKQMLVSDPSYAALVSRLDTMLKQAEMEMVAENDAPPIFKNVGAVLRYLQEEKGRQIAKSKLYRDIKSGLLRKAEKHFRQIDVDRYAATLPLGTTPDGRANDAEERMRRKDEADIRIKEAQAIREEKKNAILEGKYINREDMYQELAARAVALHTGIKSAIQAGALDIIIAVGGNKERTDLLARELEKIIDAACSEYARDIEFDVQVGFFDDVVDEDEAKEDGTE